MAQCPIAGMTALLLASLMPIGESIRERPLSLKACLAEMRSDWAGYKEVLDFPSWSSKGHICWRCNCQRDSLKRFEDDTLERLPDLVYHFFQYARGQFLGRKTG